MLETRIKEQQLDLFADRTSCHRWWPNQFWLLLSSLAYTLLEVSPHISHGFNIPDMGRRNHRGSDLRFLVYQFQQQYPALDVLR